MNIPSKFQHESSEQGRAHPHVSMVFVCLLSLFAKFENRSRDGSPQECKKLLNNNVLFLDTTEKQNKTLHCTAIYVDLHVCRCLEGSVICTQYQLGIICRPNHADQWTMDRSAVELQTRLCADYIVNNLCHFFPCSLSVIIIFSEIDGIFL